MYDDKGLRRVMTDKELTIEAKAIYAYLSACADHDGLIFTSPVDMVEHLNISQTRLYKHRKQLEENNYIAVEQMRNNKGWLGCAYILLAGEDK